MSTQTKYVRLLSYSDATDLISRLNEYNNFPCANITTAGICITLPSVDMNKSEKFIKDFCNSKKSKYEIVDKAPHVINTEIKEDLQRSIAEQLLYNIICYRANLPSYKTSSEHTFDPEEYNLVFPLLIQEFSFMQILYSKFSTNKEYTIIIPITQN